MSTPAIATIAWPAPPQAVLFDLDGTLADTAGDLVGAANALRTSRGLTPLPLAQLRPYASAGARGLIGAALDIHPGHEEFEPLRTLFLDTYARCLADTTCLFDGMDTVLRELEQRGIAWGVVTNKPHRFTVPVMEGLQLVNRAAVLISGDTTAHAKPHPLPLLTACELIGATPSRVLYVGDDRRDIQAAQAAGMPSAAAQWGYIGHSGDISSWGADVIAVHPMDLLQCI